MLFIIGFITLFKNNRIIIDTDYIKTLLITIGIMTFFISYLFITYNNYSKCALNFTIKHIGISVILMIICFNLSLNSRISIKKENIDKFGFSGNNNDEDEEEESKLNFESQRRESSITNNSHNIQKSTMIDRNNSISINTANNRTSRLKSIFTTNKRYTISSMTSTNSDLDNISKNSVNYDEISANIKIKKKEMNKVYIKYILLYVIFLISITVITLINKENNLHLINSKNKNYWYYQCSLKNYDSAFNTIYFVIYIYIIITAKSVLRNDCIFKYIQQYLYSSIIATILGPIMNVYYIILYLYIYIYIYIYILYIIFYFYNNYIFIICIKYIGNNKYNF